MKHISQVDLASMVEDLLVLARQSCGDDDVAFLVTSWNAEDAYALGRLDGSIRLARDFLNRLGVDARLYT